MRKHKNIKFLRFSILLLMLLLIALLLWLLWKFVPRASVRFCLLAVCAGILAAAGLLNWYQRLQISSFAGEICETLDALMSGSAATRSLSRSNPFTAARLISRTGKTSGRNP